MHTINISTASALGLKETLPPYLNKNLTLKELKTGVTFASAGSGYNNATCKTSVSRPRTYRSISVCSIGRAGLSIKRSIYIYMVHACNSEFL